MQDIKQKIYNAMDIPKETFMNIPLTTIMGNDEIIVENYKAVIDYKSDMIKINTKIGQVKITGKNINIKHIKKDEIHITGVIKNIEYGN